MQDVDTSVTPVTLSGELLWSIGPTQPGASAPSLSDGDFITWDDANQRFTNSSKTITLAELKAEVAAATDFADFQSRIAAL